MKNKQRERLLSFGEGLHEIIKERTKVFNMKFQDMYGIRKRRMNPLIACDKQTYIRIKFFLGEPI